MRYDIIVAGAGLAGLSFVHNCLKRNKTSSILLVDECDKKVNDRTWSFWSVQPPDYQCVLPKHWEALGFASDNYVRFEDIEPYTYYTIRGLDFYQEVFNEINSAGNVDFLQGKVENIHTGEEVKVSVAGTQYCGSLLIDTIHRPIIDASHLLNWQNFLGWTIHTDTHQFNPDKPILMDYRVPQCGASSFVYFLPHNQHEALVEYTQFTSLKAIDKADYREQLEAYIHDVLKVSQYKVVEEEVGQIPMTNYKFPRKPKSNVIRLGTAGGDTKPTTGYTFQRVQESCQVILNEMEGKDSPTTEKSRFEFYDELLLKIIRDQPEQVKKIMEFLFKNQPMNRILKFLDEDTNVLEEALIFGLLPWKPFLQALVNRKHAGIV